MIVEFSLLHPSPLGLQSIQRPSGRGSLLLKKKQKTSHTYTHALSHTHTRTQSLSLPLTCTHVEPTSLKTQSMVTPFRRKARIDVRTHLEVFKTNRNKTKNLNQKSTNRSKISGIRIKIFNLFGSRTQINKFFRLSVCIQFR